jgi:hypothetical protein
VNNANLRAGDGVLFQGGQRFTDDELMPAQSGTTSAHIVYGSYGSGQATITQGVWFVNLNSLTFDNLSLGPVNGFQGGNTSGKTANDIVVQRSTIGLSASNPAVGINATGNNWTIAGNTVDNIGNSGMLVQGGNYTISGNTIDHTGLDSALDFGKHGIYLKATNATVSNNEISHFSSDGVSARYRDSTISGNVISNGAIGIGFFQYDATAATSHWTNNDITGTTAAGIYVSKSDQGGSTRESFVISGNTLDKATHAESGWAKMNLQATSGIYSLSSNNS